MSYKFSYVKWATSFPTRRNIVRFTWSEMILWGILIWWPGGLQWSSVRRSLCGQTKVGGQGVRGQITDISTWVGCQKYPEVLRTSIRGKRYNRNIDSTSVRAIGYDLDSMLIWLSRVIHQHKKKISMFHQMGQRLENNSHAIQPDWMQDPKCLGMKWPL